MVLSKSLIFNASLILLLVQWSSLSKIWALSHMMQCSRVVQCVNCYPLVPISPLHCSFVFPEPCIYRSSSLSYKCIYISTISGDLVNHPFASIGSILSLTFISCCLSIVLDLKTVLMSSLHVRCSLSSLRPFTYGRHSILISLSWDKLSYCLHAPCNAGVTTQFG